VLGVGIDVGDVVVAVVFVVVDDGVGVVDVAGVGVGWLCWCCC